MKSANNKKPLFSSLFIILFFLIFNFLFFASNINAAAPLEVKYPKIKDITIETVETPLEVYIKYLYYFILSIGGIVGLISLIWAGFNYLTSTGIPERMKEARERITSVILGLVILFGSWLILYTINPNFGGKSMSLAPNLPSVAPGVYLCKETDGYVVNVVDIWRKLSEVKKEKAEGQRKQKEGLFKEVEKIEKYCYLVKTAQNIPQEFENKVGWAFTIPYIGETKKARMGAILYNRRDFQGESQQVVYDLDYNGGSFKIEIGASSVRPFILKERNEIEPSWHVKLYQYPNYNEGRPKAKSKEYYTYGMVSPCYPVAGDFPKPGPNKNIFDAIGTADLEGEIFAIFFKDWQCGAEWPGDTTIYVLTTDDSNLKDNFPISKFCQAWSENTQRWVNVPCAESMVIVSGGFY